MRHLCKHYFYFCVITEKVAFSIGHTSNPICTISVNKSNERENEHSTPHTQYEYRKKHKHFIYFSCLALRFTIYGSRFCRVFHVIRLANHRESAQWRKRARMGARKKRMGKRKKRARQREGEGREDKMSSTTTVRRGKFMRPWARSRKNDIKKSHCFPWSISYIVCGL